MLQLNSLTIKLKDEQKIILKDINLSFKKGKTIYLSGKNGSGKSTLVSTIMGDPRFEITDGEILFDNSVDPSLHPPLKGEGRGGVENPKSKIQDPKANLRTTHNPKRITLNDLSPDERSHVGIYLANQHPIEIPGVSLMQYLRLIFNVRRPKDDQLPVFKFRQLLHEKAELINYPKELLQRNLNEGFSGGEKKKTEILQLLVLEPRFIMLDEVDSGLDKGSIEDVFTGLAKYRKQNPESTFLIISHYDKVKEYLKPDREIEMSELN